MTRGSRALSISALATLSLALSACGDPPDADRGPDSAVTGSSSRDGGAPPTGVAPGSPRSSSAPPSAPLLLDPTARPGDRVGELVVRENMLRRADATDAGWVGEVRFEGPIDLDGEIRPHPVDRESDAVCFFPDDASARRLPRLAGDERYAWMCFANPEGARSLRPGGSSGDRHSVTVEDFLYAFSYSDVHNVARLVAAEPASAAGCYALELGAWDPPRRREEEPLQTPPSSFALLDSIGDAAFERGQRIARPRIGLQGGSASWSRVGADSVRVAWTTGYVGVRLDLEVTPRGLEGTATAFSDVVGRQPWPSAPATAVRTAC